MYHLSACSAQHRERAASGHVYIHRCIHTYIHIYIDTNTSRESVLGGSDKRGQSRELVVGCCMSYVHVYIHSCTYVYIYIYIYIPTHTNILPEGMLSSSDQGGQRRELVVGCCMPYVYKA